MLVTLHAYDVNIDREWWEAGHAGSRRRMYHRRLIAMACDPQVRFIAVSRALYRKALTLGIPGEKLDVHYIGVDTDKFRPGGLRLRDRAKRILFLGRLVEKKGVSHLIRAFAMLHQHAPEAELRSLATCRCGGALTLGR